MQKPDEQIISKLRNNIDLYSTREMAQNPVASIRLYKNQIKENNNPQEALLGIGIAYIFSGDLYSSLNAYTRAVSFHQDSEKTEIALQQITTIMDHIKRDLSKKQEQHLEIVRHFLIIAGCLCKDPQNPVVSEPLKRLAIREYRVKDTPVMIIAGGSNKAYEKSIFKYRNLVDTALKDFKGIIFSGGTDAGVCRLAGDLNSGQIQKIAYFPRFTPDNAKRHSDYVIVETNGIGFSPLEPIQCWIDLVASGIKPSRVKLLGINGGRIAAFEFRMALAFGAAVGIISDSGRAVQELRDDSDWNEHPRLYNLPNDPIAVKNFCFGIG